MTTTTLNLPLALYEIEAIQFGDYTLRSGLKSPFYIDLRRLISYPGLLSKIAQALFSQVAICDYDLVCGVPYTALPIATAFSIQSKIPMVMRRKERKEYGTKKIIEGVFQKGQRCLVIEDLVTSGSSVLETVSLLEKEGLIVTDIAVVLDRKQGGKKRLLEKGYNLHSLCTITNIIENLRSNQQITDLQFNQTCRFIEENQL